MREYAHPLLCEASALPGIGAAEQLPVEAIRNRIQGDFQRRFCELIGSQALRVEVVGLELETPVLTENERATILAVHELNSSQREHWLGVIDQIQQSLRQRLSRGRKRYSIRLNCLRSRLICAWLSVERARLSWRPRCFLKRKPGKLRLSAGLRALGPGSTKRHGNDCPAQAAGSRSKASSLASHRSFVTRFA